VGGELESVTSSAGCFVQGWRPSVTVTFLQANKCWDSLCYSISSRPILYSHIYAHPWIHYQISAIAHANVEDDPVY